MNGSSMDVVKPLVLIERDFDIGLILKPVEGIKIMAILFQKQKTKTTTD